MIPPSVLRHCAFGHTYVYGTGLHDRFMFGGAISPFSLSPLVVLVGGICVPLKTLPTLLLTHTKHTNLCLIRIRSMKMIITPTFPSSWSWWWFFLHIPPNDTIDEEGFVQWWWPRVCASLLTHALRDWSMMTHCDETFYFHKKKTHTHTHTHTIVSKDGLMMAHCLETLLYKHTN